MGVIVHVDVIATFISAEQFAGICAIVPKDASISFDLVEMDCVFKLLHVVYIGF
jgi:hypothetical protein